MPDAALALVARGGRGAYRDAESTLDQLASATSGTISVADVLALLGTVEDEVLFRLCDHVVDQDTAGALTFLEELSEQGQDLGRLVIDLLEHLRHLMLVQATGGCRTRSRSPTRRARRLREQADQLGAPTVLRLIACCVAVDDAPGGVPGSRSAGARQVTRPGSDLSASRWPFGSTGSSRGRPARPKAESPRDRRSHTRRPGQGIHLRSSAELQSVARSGCRRWRPRPRPGVLAEAHPRRSRDTLTLEFRPRPASTGEGRGAEGVTLLADALYEVTGRRLGLRFITGERAAGKREPTGLRRRRSSS